MNTCSIEGCNKEAKARGLCGTHYERRRKYGDPNHVIMPRWDSSHNAILLAATSGMADIHRVADMTGRSVKAVYARRSRLNNLTRYRRPT